MQKVILIGNVGKDAEVRSVNGRNAISFSIAVSEKVKGEDKTTWWNATLWRDADKSGVAQYIKKGGKVYVEGKPSARTWDKDGQVQVSMDVTVDQLHLLSSKQDSQSGGSQHESEPEF